MKGRIQVDERNRQPRKKLIMGCYRNIMRVNLKTGTGKATLSLLKCIKLDTA